jgi:Ca2+-binding RTX toxin-like protein
LAKRRNMLRKVTTMLVVIAAMLVLGSGIALAVTKVGTDGPDKLWGTNGEDTLKGKGGNDWLFGLKGDDDLYGGKGKDWAIGGNNKVPMGGEKEVTGGLGNDAVLGGRVADTIEAGRGNDFADGGPGGDEIVSGPGDDYLRDGEDKGGVTDNLFGGKGKDVFDPFNNPAKKDIVKCGPGFDRVLADSADVTADGCEKVARGPEEYKELNKQLSKEGGFYDTLFGGLGPPAIKGL